MQKPAIDIEVDADGQTLATATMATEGQVIVAHATHPDPAVAEQVAREGATSQRDVARLGDGTKGPTH
ncbi:hypothetical protein HYW59_04740 [Candidatus Kaiserbacteria bacterium]|nr:hypothetical protein [Candidatus Kaiserbacteria bacterium]